MQFSRTIKSSLTKIRKRYFFRCNNISSHGFFSFFIITFCIGFTRGEKKYVKVIDDDICNRKIKFKAKSEAIKMNRNYKIVDKKIWRILKCKEVVALRDSCTKFDLYDSAFESLFSQMIRIWKLFSRSVGTYLSYKLLCLQRETALRHSRNKFLLSIGASPVGKAGFSLKHGNMRHIFRQSKIKIIK